jgi:hypothetical protein
VRAFRRWLTALTEEQAASLYRDSDTNPNPGSGFPLPRFRGGQVSRE